MKDRITTPWGFSVILDHLIAYHAKGMTVYLMCAGEDTDNCACASFQTEEERDAFLARLDAYFQEIP